MDIEIVFGEEDLERMCLDKLKSLETFEPGAFEAEFSPYNRQVKCTFVPAAVPKEFA